MDQIYRAARTFNQLAITVVLMLVLFLVMAPGLAGTWMAQRDIAYDRVWGATMLDCDCTDELP